jgi:hypothetical protein
MIAPDGDRKHANHYRKTDELMGQQQQKIVKIY